MEANEVDWQYVYDTDEFALKEAEDGGILDVWGAQSLVLIGPGFNAEYYDLWERLPTAWRGTVKITKASWRPGDHGKLEFTGAHDRAELEATIAAFSQKKVEYTD